MGRCIIQKRVISFVKNLTVIFIELFVRIRRLGRKKELSSTSLAIIDSFRMGFVYGLFMEGFKLL